MFYTLHVDTGNEWRGGQKQVLSLVLGMLDSDYPCTLACPKGSPLWKRAKAKGVNVVHIPPGWSFLGIKKLAGFRCDIIACHTSHAHGMASVQGNKFIVHRRVDFIPSSPWKYRRAAGYIAVSSAVASILQQVGARNVYIVPDGVDEIKAEKIDCSPDILTVGALVEHKGHRYLSKAAQILPDFTFAVAGIGPLVYPNLNYLGYRKDVPDLMASSRVFVHPSTEEGMGQVLIEALLAKIPIVATNVGGIPDVLGDNGVLVPSKDPEALAEGIRQVISGNHPCLDKGYLHAKEKFSTKRMAENTIFAYGEILRSISTDKILSQG